MKKGIFDIKTPVKTPKKIHFFNKTSTQNKVPQKYESSTFVEKDCRTCVLCNQKGNELFTLSTSYDSSLP